MLNLAGFNSTIYSFNNKTWVSLTPSWTYMSDGWDGTGISDRPTTIAPLKAVLKTGKVWYFAKPPLDEEKIAHNIFLENEPLMRETNFTLGPI